MAIKGLGTDIVEIARISNAVKSSDRFSKRVLTNKELTIYQSSPDGARYLAKRWAAKEAASKALGVGIGQGISFQHFETSNDELGAPILELSGVALELAKRKGITQCHISISDEQHYAMATVILE